MERDEWTTKIVVMCQGKTAINGDHSGVGSLMYYACKGKYSDVSISIIFLSILSSVSEKCTPSQIT